MLYVFHVDMGRMLKFDMNIALSSVSNLKDTIERQHGIPAQSIVLLVSGGEMLTKSTQVSFYSAGTDTNPIYMFLMGDVKLSMLMPTHETEVDLKDEVDRCLSLPVRYETVVTRAKLAQQMYELAQEEETKCERLVHEQHLQQQGWSAVIANLEDLTKEFRRRYSSFCKSFDDHLEKRPKFIQLLQNFSDDLSKLSKIPILPGLMQMAQEDFHGFDEILGNDEVFSRSQQNVSVLIAQDPQCSMSQALDSYESHEDDKRESTSPNKKPKMGDDEKGESQSISSTESGTRWTLTLLQWISAKENHNKLREMSEECIQGLKAFDENVYAQLKDEINNVIKSADQNDMKEVKGLSERLCRLEQMKHDISGMVKDQKELSLAFYQNQTRANNLKDASVLPDLCDSHKNQLLVMYQNQQKVRDFRRCISRAKDELGSNLHTRLKRIVHLENKMSEFDNRQLFYHRCLRRAERHINIIEQIHQAPCIYVAAVTEVVRRKIFSGEFRQWASKLAEDFDSIHSEEINRRRNFNESFEGHFLNILFPGMNDMPPAFANENPLAFDADLPNITKNDIDILTAHLPDLSNDFQLPDMGPVINFFVSRSGNANPNVKSSMTSKNLQTEIICTLSAHHQRILDLQSHLKDGCEESETDTEEFEKVVQPELSPTVNTSGSTSENVYQVTNAETSTEPLQTNTVETLTENESSPPKKPPRHTKNQMTSNFISTKLPVLPSNSINLNLVHDQLNTLSVIPEKDTPTSCESENYNCIAPFPSYTCHQSDGDCGDGENEFINSEFYIDESLSSSYCDPEGDGNDDEEDIPQSSSINLEYFVKTDLHYMSSTYPSEVNKKMKNKILYNTQESMETIFGLLQENLGSTRLEVERLKSILKAMFHVSTECIKLARTNLQQIKFEQVNHQHDFCSEFQNLSEQWKLIQMQYESREQDIIDMRENNRQALQNLEEIIIVKDKEILDLKKGQQEQDNTNSEKVLQLETNYNNLEHNYKKLEKEIESLNCCLEEARSDKLRAVEEIKKQLTDEYKTEKESLRCRYKLMTKVERSPSDTSLEKIDKQNDVIELTCHEAIISQIRDDLTAEKDLAIKDAIKSECSVWEKKMQSMLEEKDKDIDLLREQIDVLRKENLELKTQISNEYNDEPNSWVKQKIDALNHEKHRIEEELNMEKSRRSEMELSLADLKGSTMETSTLPRSKSSGSSHRYAALDVCSKGDIVFVVWSKRHCQFMVVQDSANLYFVHCESLSALNLKIPAPGEPDVPSPFYGIGRVIHKEYCQAKRDENRYKVSKGSRFYRIKLEAIFRSDYKRRERLESSSSNVLINRSLSQNDSYDSSGQHLNALRHVPLDVELSNSPGLKERTISITSVTEEEDEHISLLSDRCRYISVSEEEEINRPVITEQPTSSYYPSMDNASASSSTTTTTVNAPASSNVITTSRSPMPIQILANIGSCSLEKDTDDSDDYRSLEAKDDNEFPPMSQE